MLKQRSNLRMVSNKVCKSLSWQLEEVAMGVALVIKLGTMQQSVLLMMVHSCCLVKCCPGALDVLCCPGSM